jgi:hypothetical protein
MRWRNTSPVSPPTRQRAPLAQVGSNPGDPETLPGGMDVQLRSVVPARLDRYLQVRARIQRTDCAAAPAGGCVRARGRVVGDTRGTSATRCGGAAGGTLPSSVSNSPLLGQAHGVSARSAKNHDNATSLLADERCHVMNATPVRPSVNPHLRRNSYRSRCVRPQGGHTQPPPPGPRGVIEILIERKTVDNRGPDT